MFFTYCFSEFGLEVESTATYCYPGQKTVAAQGFLRVAAACGYCYPAATYCYPAERNSVPS